MTDDGNTICDNTSSDFQDLYQSMVTAGYTDDVTYDTEIHEYTFVLTATKELCEIGYQSQPGVATTPYVMEVVDNSTATTIYSDSHTFSSTTTSYVTLTSTVILQANTSYTIKRIQTNWAPNIGNTIGRLARRSSMTFPYSYGIMTITAADFHQNGGPLTNLGVPYIDIILR